MLLLKKELLIFIAALTRSQLYSSTKAEGYNSRSISEDHLEKAESKAESTTELILLFSIKNSFLRYSDLAGACINRIGEKKGKVNIKEYEENTTHINHMLHLLDWMWRKDNRRRDIRKRISSRRNAGNDSTDGSYKWKNIIHDIYAGNTSLSRQMAYFN